MLHPTSGAAGRLARAAKAASTLSLGKLYAGAMLLIALSYWGNVLRTFPYHTGADSIALLDSVLTNGAFNIAAWAMIAARVRGIVAPTRRASLLQIGFVVAVALICLVPRSQATVGPLLAFGIILMRSSGTYDGKCVGMLLLAIAAELIWGAFYLSPLHATVAKLDAQAVAIMLGLAGQSIGVYSNVLESGSAQHSIEVLGFCASSFPLAGLGVAYLVTKLYLGHTPGRADLPWFAAALLASIVLTELRLCMLALSGPSYDWWHDGDGATVYTLAELAISVLFPVAATWNAQAAGKPGLA